MLLSWILRLSTCLELQLPAEAPLSTCLVEAEQTEPSSGWWLKSVASATQILCDLGLNMCLLGGFRYVEAAN